MKLYEVTRWLSANEIEIKLIIICSAKPYDFKSSPIKKAYPIKQSGFTEVEEIK